MHAELNIPCLLFHNDIVHCTMILVFQMSAVSLAVCLVCLAGTWQQSWAFYVPGVAPMDFRKGQAVDIRVRIFTSSICPSFILYLHHSLLSSRLSNWRVSKLSCHMTITPCHSVSQIRLSTSQKTLVSLVLLTLPPMLCSPSYSFMYVLLNTFRI